MDSFSLSKFKGHSVDADTRAYIAALEAFDSAVQIQELKQLEQKSLVLPQAPKVLDVGCGFGLETLRIARRLASSAKVCGLDVSANFLAEAKRRSNEAGLKIAFEKGDAQRLPFADNSFDYVRAERVLIYLKDPELALREIQRVASDGACLAVIEPDFSSTNINHPDRKLARKILTYEVETAVEHNALPGTIDASLRNLPDYSIATRVVVMPQELAYGYFDSVGKRAYTAGAVTDTELSSWSDGLEALARDRSVFGTVGYFLFTARA
ncbi:methyltransferase domain-containing protein [Ruegeria arenilitoris]|uniref:methyltransferase domain-containing protein n=1 Tax=Ruegeria arenilitoris TaxID=1173585 RepID=UPI00147B0962